MSQINYENLKLTDTDDNGKSVLIQNSADRPNAFNSYSASKKSAADVKAMFDAPFLLVKKRFNALIDVVKGVGEKVDTFYSAYERGELKGDSYEITEADKAEIADIIVREYVDGDEVKY